jgi:hypothetical protein
MVSHCIYCNSNTYGRPCIFSPTKTHVHFDVANKCIYCGSKVLGSGCPFNPFGKIHIRGAEYLANVKEQVEKSSILKYLYENITKTQEIKYSSPLTRFYRRLCGILSNASDPLLEAFKFQSKPNYANLSKEQTVHIFELKEKLKFQLKNFSNTVKNANLTLPQEIVEEILIDAIISDDGKKK